MEKNTSGVNDPKPEGNENTPTPEGEGSKETQISVEEFNQLKSRVTEQQEALNSVTAESVKRKNRIKELEEQLEGKGNKDEDAEARAKRLEEKNNQLQETLQSISFKTQIQKLVPDAVSDRVTDMIYEDAKKADRLDEALVPGFVKTWKEENSSFFKQEVKASPAAAPGVPDGLRKPDAPNAVAPEQELEAWEKMDRGQQTAYEREHPGTRSRMRKLRMNNIARSMRETDY